MAPWTSSVLRTLGFGEGLFCLNVAVMLSVVWLNFARPHVDTTALSVTGIFICLAGAASMAAMRLRVRRMAEGGEPQETSGSEGPLEPEGGEGE